MKKPERLTKINNISKKSRFARYLEADYRNKTKKEIYHFWKEIFEECLTFAYAKIKPVSCPKFHLRFVDDIKYYEEIERVTQASAIVEEEAKYRSTAFVVHNRI